MKTGKINGFFMYIAVSCSLIACSAEKNNILSKSYHNTTSHYNAYYYANERIKEIENIVNTSNQNNFNDILRVYPKFDTTLSSTFKTQTEDCIKKASISIQMHKNSKWVDDSYILLGFARFYDRDFVNAIETFKYVNTKSEDDYARHKALAHLVRTFTDYGEYTNAQAVIDYLKKEDINKENKKLLWLNKAHLYQELVDYDKMVENLVQVAPLLSQNEGRAKMFFIIGQIYQQLGFDAEAYNNYKKCLSSNPVYELYFYARLNMAQVAQLKSSSDLRSVRKHFKKLLNDKKNKEFQDKIYYEMAEFEAKQGNVDLSIAHYKSSAQASVGNNRQKGMSFLKLGAIYYETLKNYEQARDYYDSTIQVLPKDYKNYESIKERQEVLDEFVTQINIIQTQDSLLSLVALDSATLLTKLSAIVDDLKAEEALKKKKEKRKKKSQSYVSPFDQGQNSNIASAWYFDNPSLVSDGQSEFRRKWGTRVLEDHWRRSNKSITAGGPSQEGEEQTAAATTANQDTPLENEEENLVANMYNQLPFSEDQKNKAMDKMEEAYYKLGNIYNFKLNEKDNAGESFKTLLSRFPETNHEPEVLYLLYLIYMESQPPLSDTYKESLLTNYPYSTYSKLISNPSYTEDSNEATTKQKAIYEKAYRMYKAENFDKALVLINEGLTSIIETSFSARLLLLRILIIGKTEDIGNYKYELGKFIEENPDSDVTEFAKTLLSSSEDFEKKLAKKKGIRYIEDFTQPHYFALVYNATEGITDKITTIVEAFNSINFDSHKFTTSNLTYTDTHALILVTEFEGIEFAIQYFSKFKSSEKEIEVLSNSKIHTFVITKDNFGIFYQNKGLEEYKSFFNKNYN